MGSSLLTFRDNVLLGLLDPWRLGRLSRNVGRKLRCAGRKIPKDHKVIKGNVNRRVRKSNIAYLLPHKNSYWVFALLGCYATCVCRPWAAPKRRQTTINIRPCNNPDELGNHPPAMQAWNLARTSTAYNTLGSVNLTHASYAAWLGMLSNSMQSFRYHLN